MTIRATDPKFAGLARVLSDAFDQVAAGKGAERHGNGLAFEDQPILTITRMLSTDGPAFQVIKKVQEACGMVRREQFDAAERELLGAINYAAAIVVRIREMNHTPMRTTEKFSAPQGISPVIATPQGIFPVGRPKHPDDYAIERFAEAMKDKMARKRAEGRSGWENPQKCLVTTLSEQLIEHVATGDPVDVANYAMMIHQRGGRIGAGRPEPNRKFQPIEERDRRIAALEAEITAMKGISL